MLDKLTLGFQCYLNDRTYCVTHDKPVSNSDTTTLVKQIAESVTLETALEYMPRYKLLRRADRIINTSDRHVLLRQPGSTIGAPADGGLYGFDSTWCKEFVPVHTLELGSKTRSCNGAQPYFALSSPESGAVVVNLLPLGDWRVRLIAENDQPVAVIDNNEEGFERVMEPGESYDFTPEYVISVYEDPCPYPSGVGVQQYLSEKLRSPELNRPLPVVYNTWFDHFHKISIEGMLHQARAAKEVGCEVFAIDAGWFGPGVRHWSYVGDWRENPSVFADISLSEFSNKIRAMGMQFGLWMEPERIHADAPDRLDHPEWFILSQDSDYYYPDLNIPEVCEWMYESVSAVLSKYDVRWLKIDCNGMFSDDPYESGHRTRMEKFYFVMDRLIANFPDTVFEGCASGGLRADLSTMRYYHAHFLSDTVDPVDTINFSASARIRLKPGHETKWAVIYPASGFTPYDSEPQNTGDYVLSPTLATSYKLSTFHLPFVVLAAMPGVLGIGGNIADLSPENKQSLAKWIGIYRENRHFIQNATGIALTGVKEPEDSAIRAMQLLDDTSGDAMLFIYNIGLQPTKACVKPCLPTGSGSWKVTDLDTGYSSEIASEMLAREGLPEVMLEAQQAVVFKLEAC